ncbi:MAG: hypothetical protein K1X95_09905 [Acidimicrobiia bacterium]|nr:hypothetical protein [Acidimicrobiia bacterium]
MLSSFDDFPVHQIAEPVRHVGTSDRNFYDRYYFNCHACSGEIFLVLGMGVYPNLGTQDAFASCTRDGTHHVVRASRALGDRGDLEVGPFRIDVLEPLQRLRFVLEPSEHTLAFDLTWEGVHAPYEEPRHTIRQFGRTVFDTVRFAQNGSWSGTLTVGDEVFDVTADHWWGARDRSWGVRPVGEPEPQGIRRDLPQLVGMWNYAPMRFDDFSLLYILQEEPDGTRTIEDAVRIPHDRGAVPEPLGRPEFHHVLDPGTRMISTASTFTFPHAAGGPVEVVCTPLTHDYMAIGTGYGLGDDFRHGMYRGDLVVEGSTWPTSELDTWAWFAIVEHCARFELHEPDGVTHTGFGMHEHLFVGPFPRLGLDSAVAVAPGSQEPTA